MCTTSGDMIDIDGMLWLAGDFGRYQFLLMSLFSVINVLSAFHYFGQTFISVVPGHSCRLTPEEEAKGGVAATQCLKIVHGSANSSRTVPCDSGWAYNNTDGFTGIVEELDWVCRDDWKPAIGQSMFFVGSVAGSLAFGVLADRIGRLRVLVAANLLAGVGNAATIFAWNATTFACGRFLAGCATDTNFVMMYIIVMEYIRPSMRTLGLNVSIGLFYCLGCVTVPWVAIAFTNWKTFLLFISVPHLAILSFPYLVPESAQWLISKGRIDEAITCFKRIATVNRQTVDDKSIDALRKYCAQYVSTSEKHESLIGLLKTPKLRKKMLILIFKSMAMTLCYDAISRNINGLQYSPFVIFSITSTTILPACLFISAIQDRVGRKALASCSLLISGIFTICSGIIQSIHTPDASLIVAFAIIARLGINVAYNSGAQYAVELIPTVVRGQGVSAIHVVGYAASFFSPHILYLATIWKPSPEVILGIVLILGALACLFLPETLNKTLPVTLQDGEEFGEDEGIFEFACFHAPTESTTTLTPKQVQNYSN